MAITPTNFKQFRAKHLRRFKVWFWYKTLLIDTWWVKHFGKKYTPEELIKKLKDEALL